MKNVVAFCLCLKSLLEAKVTRFILIALTKEVSKIPSRDFVLWFSLMKSVLMKMSKLKKEKYKVYGSSNKGTPGSEIKLNPMFKKQIKIWE